MKTSSTGFLVLAVTWILVSLLWFFWVKNMWIGGIWLCAGILELAVALISRRKEKRK